MVVTIFVDDIVNQSNDGALEADKLSRGAGTLGTKISRLRNSTPMCLPIEGLRVGGNVDAGKEIVKDALLAIPSWSITTDHRQSLR